jgi:hypothetical protein
MKRATFTTTIGAGLAVGWLLLVSPLPLTAQDAPVEQQGQTGHTGGHGMMEHGKRLGMRAKMRQHHEEMEKLHQEMGQELEKQMTALREHTKTMDGITDEKQLLTEMKKHQQMTDTLLGTMLEQREKMHAQMKKHHERMHDRMGKDQPSEGSGTEPSGEHEQHHGK